MNRSRAPKWTRGASGERWRFAFLARATFGTFLLWFFRVRVEGLENVPATGAILAGNHVSHLDPMLMWVVTPRPASFVAKAELWDSRLLGWMLDRFWAFPVKRGTADRTMISEATKLLAGGALVGMFPEGTRNRSEDAEALGEAHGGVAFIASRAGVPVVPVGIDGTRDALPAGRSFPVRTSVMIRFGEPFVQESTSTDRKTQLAEFTSQIMSHIAQERARAKEANAR